MRKLLFTLTAIIALAASALAQNKIEIGGGYLNTELQANPIESIEYLKGYYAEVDGTIVHKNGFRLSGVFLYQKAYNIEVVPAGEAYPMGLRRNVQTFSFGARVSKKFGPVRPFGSFLVGFRKPNGDTNDAIDYEPVRKYQAGADLIFGESSHFGIRPFFVEFEATGGFGDTRTQKYGAGLFFRL